ncbi:hypothetical protein [Dactylosporangium sp. CA-092794]|uniref:hypothetical protein n=1 Tax=Dactylosporangium sp. CA-092794 TaxID=3239929 RepID=UPI003D8A3310
MTLRITNPTAFRDQVRAAGAHARRRLADAAEHGVVERDPAPPRGWLAEQFTVLLAALHDGTVRTCPHVERGGPQLLNAAAWAPGMIVCGNCTDLLTPTGPARDTCDRCQRPVPAANGGIAAIGPLMFAYALCDPCKHEQAAG